jgi:signal transduction histidine kinase
MNTAPVIQNATLFEQRIARLELLSQFGKSFSAILDLQDLLEHIASAATGLTLARQVTIYLIDTDSGKMARRVARAAVDVQEYIELSSADDFARHVIHSQTHLVLKANHPIRDLPLTSPHPLIFAPLTSNGRTIGVIGVYGRTEAADFTKQDIDFLISLSSYAAVAIDNALLYERALAQTRELTLLVESANAFSWSLDPQSVLEKIATYVMQATDTSGCLLSTWSAETQTLATLAEHRNIIWTAPDSQSRSLDSNPLFAQAVHSKQPVIKMAGASSDIFPKHRNMQWLAVLPVLYKNQVIGLLEVASAQPTSISTHTIAEKLNQPLLSLASAMQDQAAGQPGKRLKSIGESVLKMPGIDFCACYQVDAQSGNICPVFSIGTGYWLESDAPLLEVSREYDNLHIVLSEQRIATLHQLSGETISTEMEGLLPEPGAGTLLLLPLVIHAETIGLIQLFDLRPDREFTAREMGLALAIANQAAVALANANLVSDLQNSLQRQKALQSELVRSARLSALGEMSAVIAHQINNPLTTVLADAEMMLHDLPADHLAYPSALAIQKAGKRARSVVEQMLAIARSSSAPVEVDINHSIHEVIDLLHNTMKIDHLNIESYLAEGIPGILAIPGHIDDVWMNLLINARDALRSSGREGHIRIATLYNQEQQVAEVTIEDNGPGMSAQDMDNAFDPFFTTKPVGAGTGLGLYICKQILQEHHGDIRIESVPGQGTRIIVQIPVIRKAV